MERIRISLCSLVIVFLAVNSVSALALPRGNKFRCSLCEEKDLLRCADLKCPPGSTPVMDTCGRCKICGKMEEEECGGVCSMFGFCSEGLQCYTGPLKTEKKFDVRMIAEKFTNAGRCMKPSDIPKSEPKKSRPEKPDIVYFSSRHEEGKLVSEWISSDDQMESSSTNSDPDFTSQVSDSFASPDFGSGVSEPSSSDRILWSEGGTLNIMSSSDDSRWSDGSSYTSKDSSFGDLKDRSGNVAASGVEGSGNSERRRFHV